MLNKIPLPKPGKPENEKQPSRGKLQTNQKPQLNQKPKLPIMQSKAQQNEVQQEKAQQKEVQRRKAKQNNTEEGLSPEIVELRKTDRWKSMYMRNLQSKDAIKGGEKYKEKVYCDLIDRLASPPVDQNNILASFSGFASKRTTPKSDNLPH